MRRMLTLLSRPEGRELRALWALIGLTLLGLLLLPVRLAFAALAVIGGILVAYGLLAAFALALAAEPAARGRGPAQRR